MFVVRLIVTLLFSLFLLYSQTIDSVLIVSDPEFVFSYRPYHQKGATLTVTVFDENNQPVGADVPLAIEVYHAVLKGPTLFKSQISADTTITNIYYFKTNGDGQILIDFYPYKFVELTYEGIKAQYLQPHPNATEEEILQEYKRQNTLNLWFYTVRFTDPNNEQSAILGYYKPAKTASVFPVLYGYNKVIIDAQTRDDSPYLFTAENFNADPVPITIQALDMFNKPLPAGCLLYLYAYWGNFSGAAVVHSEPDAISSLDDYPFRGGGDFYVRLGEQGTARMTYQPPPVTMPPFTHWAETRIKWGDYATKDEAWQAYTGNQQAVDIKGTAVFYSIKGAAPNYQSFPTYLHTRELKIDSLNSLVPALVGVDQVEITTRSPRSGYYVYVSETFAESATLRLTAYDSDNRSVPAGTPIGISLNYNTSDAANSAFITGPTVVYNDGSFFVVRLEEGGTTEVQYWGPRMPFRIAYWEGESGPYGEIYDEKYSGILSYFPVPAYRISETDGSSYWITAGPYVNVASRSNVNTFPVLLGPQSASIFFHPSTLLPFDFFARVHVYVKDALGNPAPKGSNVFVKLRDGHFENGQQTMNILVRSANGRATVGYFSPTRPLTYTYGYDRLTAFQDAYGNELASKRIKLIGTAISWYDGSLSEWILGFDLVEFLKDLNPLKAFGALNDFVRLAEQTGQQWNQLYEKIYQGTATDADFDAYQQSWQTLANQIGYLAQTIPNTSFTGPSLSARTFFQNLSTSGLRHTLKNTAYDMVVTGIQKKMLYNFFIFHLSLFYPDSPNRAAALFKNKATYSAPSFVQMGKLELLGDLFTLPSETGMYEMYGYRFRIQVQDSALLNGAVQVGDQWPIDGYLIPERYSLFGYPKDAVVASNGFFEITEINPQENYLEGIAIGYLFNDPQVNPVLAFSKTIGTDGDTLNSASNAQLIVPADALTDSTQLFLLQTRPPMPLIEQDSVIMQTAFSVGSMTSDSVLQSVTFNQQATLQVIDSVSRAASDPWQAYWFDVANQSWVKLTDAGYVNDSLFALPVSQTGVYGLARAGSKHNEYPVLSSFKDTTIVMNSTLEVSFNAYDPEGAPLTLWAESDRNEVQVSLADTILQVKPAKDWTGVAYISLFATDGQDTSVSRFKLSVVDLTAIEDLASLPKTFELYQNFPNPFNTSTTIRFDVPQATQVRLEIYNILGQRVRQLLNNRLPAGSYRLIWEGKDELGRTVSSGVYIYVFRSQDFVKIKKMHLIK